MLVPPLLSSTTVPSASKSAKLVVFPMRLPLTSNVDFEEVTKAPCPSIVSPPSMLSVVLFSTLRTPSTRNELVLTVFEPLVKENV